MIKVLPSLGSEYKIIFDLFINKFYPSTWYSILLFTVDKGRPGTIKYGDRQPALFVRDNHLWIKSAVNGNSNYFKKFPKIIEKWIKIEICQHVINNKGGDRFFFRKIPKAAQNTQEGRMAYSKN